MRVPSIRRLSMNLPSCSDARQSAANLDSIFNGTLPSRRDTEFHGPNAREKNVAAPPEPESILVVVAEKSAQPAGLIEGSRAVESARPPEPNPTIRAAHPARGCRRIASVYGNESAR